MLKLEVYDGCERDGSSARTYQVGCRASNKCKQRPQPNKYGGMQETFCALEDGIDAHKYWYMTSPRLVVIFRHQQGAQPLPLFQIYSNGPATTVSIHPNQNAKLRQQNIWRLVESCPSLSGEKTHAQQTTSTNTNNNDSLLLHNDNNNNNNNNNNDSNNRKLPYLEI